MISLIGKFKPKRSPIVAKIEPLTRNSSFLELASACEKGLSRHSPIPCDDGINGTMFIKGVGEQVEGENCRNRQNYIAVLKTNNGEEDKPYSFQNVGPGSPKVPLYNSTLISDHGLSSEEAALREFAAYKLDKKGYYGVPSTGLVKISYSGFQSGEIVSESPVVVRQRRGSLQRFRENDGSAEDVGNSLFPIKQVHKIGILDVHILNADRHDGNVLYKRGDEEEKEVKLIPIDHGFSLPHGLDKCWFGWLTWPQAKVPFGKEELEFIDSMDSDQDAKILEEIGIEEDCVFNMKVSVLLLKKGAKMGLTLYDIGALICRVNGTQKPSELEQIISQVEKLKEENEEIMIERIGQLMDEKIESIVEKKKKLNSSNSSLNNNSSKNLLRNMALQGLDKVEPSTIAALSPRLSAAARRLCAPRSPLVSPASTRRLCL